MLQRWPRLTTCCTEKDAIWSDGSAGQTSGPRAEMLQMVALGRPFLRISRMGSGFHASRGLLPNMPREGLMEDVRRLAA